MRRLLLALVLLVGCPQPPATVIIPLPGTGPAPTVPPGPTTTLPLPVIPNQTHGPGTRVQETATGNGEDCSVYCAARFGPGVAVTCQAFLTAAGACVPRCFYSNGWWFDESTGRAIHTPGGTSPEQRPPLGQVPPYAYCSEHGCAEDTWLECPQWYGPGIPSAPPHVQEACVAMARAEYHEGYAFCRQYEP